MKYGKIRIEDGNLIFAKRMLINYLPCKDILWAYMRKEGVEGGRQKQFSTSSLVIITRRKKRYEFEMTDKEIRDCIQLLKVLNPKLATGFPKGARIPLQTLPNTRDLGALATKDGRHILPRRLLRSGNLYHMSLQDQDTLLNEYHLSTVVDFRTRMEVLEKPDTVLEGVEYHAMSSCRNSMFLLCGMIFRSNSMPVFWMSSCSRKRVPSCGTAAWVKTGSALERHFFSMRSGYRWRRSWRTISVPTAAWRKTCSI